MRPLVLVLLAALVPLAGCVAREEPELIEDPPAVEPVEVEDPAGRLEEMGIPFHRWAFIEAAGEGNAEAVRFFLAAGMDPDAINSPRYAETALMWAARENRAEVARILIQAGADVNMRNARDETAMGIARMLGNEETMRLISRAGGEL